jgi:hypothetical protein
MAVVGRVALKVVLRVRLGGLISLKVCGNLILESRNYKVEIYSVVNFKDLETQAYLHKQISRARWRNQKVFRASVMQQGEQIWVEAMHMCLGRYLLCVGAFAC